MSGLVFGLRAKNNSQNAELSFHCEADGTIYPCICGTYDGNSVQIDFNGLTWEEVQDLVLLLTSMIERARVKSWVPPKIGSTKEAP